MELIPGFRIEQGGSIAICATKTVAPAIPFWPLVFSNAGVHFAGSADVPVAEKIRAAHGLKRALETGWKDSKQTGAPAIRGGATEWEGRVAIPHCSASLTSGS
jgi:hypothetical protein